MSAIPDLSGRGVRDLSPRERQLALSINQLLVGVQMNEATSALTTILVRALQHAGVPRPVFIDTIASVWDAMAKGGGR